ncbi:MAG: SDR family oxidoreductase [Bacteroidota bacterium]
MNVLITGATGYIGQRLLPVLHHQGHELFCCVRNESRFERDTSDEHIHTIEIDFLDHRTFDPLPPQLDIAFYLIHSMGSTVGNFQEQESLAAHNFLKLIEPTSCRQIIYLSGIVNEAVLSDHLLSHSNVEKILRAGRVPVTVLRAGIVVGSGSASFEIVRDLVEKLPVMVAPRWLNTKCQPIAVRNILQFLVGVMLRESTYNKDFDIGGPEVLTYKQMLLQCAAVRGLKRLIITVPVMTPRLSSYWLYFVTQISYPLAVNLVDSMKVNIVARQNDLAKELGIELLSYTTAVQRAFEKIEQQDVLSSWKDSFSSSGAERNTMRDVKVPEFGCFKDRRVCNITGNSALVWENVWTIGGEKGWYYANTLWAIRGLMDKAAGGVGLNRGRRNANSIRAGDTLDFWRVLIADKEGRRLLLFAEMKLPGEAWLEFRLEKGEDGERLVQTATFRPRGLLGRMYWYAVLPFHKIIFGGMINHLVHEKSTL